VTAQLDLRKYTALRSEEKQAEQLPVILPRGHVKATILLPVGFDSGEYKCRSSIAISARALRQRGWLKFVTISPPWRSSLTLRCLHRAAIKIQFGGSARISDCSRFGFHNPPSDHHRGARLFLQTRIHRIPGRCSRRRFFDQPHWFGRNMRPVGIDPCSLRSCVETESSDPARPGGPSSLRTHCVQPPDNVIADRPCATCFGCCRRC
jgi:hypothetical protein